MSDNLPKKYEDAPTAVAISSVEDPQYGKYIRRSKICSVCNRSNHMEINLLRARQHMTLSDIATQEGFDMKILKLHFDNHFILLPNVQKIIDLKENTSREARDLVAGILDGSVDLYSTGKAVLQSKIQRLYPITQRLKKFADMEEDDATPLEEIEIQEKIQLHKLATDIENDILKTEQVLDKKVFGSREELSNAMLSYKHDFVSKILDAVKVELMRLENDPADAPTVNKLKHALAQRFNMIEELIFQSGGLPSNQSQEGSVIAEGSKEMEKAIDMNYEDKEEK